MSLRSRLLLGLLLLVAIGLGVTAVVIYEEHRSFLLQRIDQQVVGSVPPVSITLGVVDTNLPSPRPGAPAPDSERGLSRSSPDALQAAGTYGELLDRDHRVLKRRSFTLWGHVRVASGDATNPASVAQESISGQVVHG